jgi:hypothetical protein
MHVRAALSIGVSREEIQELLLQAAVYCGVPAQTRRFHVAEEALATWKTRRIASRGRLPLKSSIGLLGDDAPTWLGKLLQGS